MDALFKFTQTRAANAKVSDINPLNLETNSSFQNDLAAIPASSTRQAQVKARAEAFAASSEFLSDANSNPNVGKLLQCHAVVIEVINTAEPLSALKARLETTLGSTINAFAADAAIHQTLVSLKDTIVAIKLLPNFHGLPLDLMATALRTYELLSFIDADSGTLKDKEVLKAMLRRSIRLPKFVTSARVRTRPSDPKPGYEQTLAPLIERYRNLTHSIKELSALKPTDFVHSVQKGSTGYLVPQKLRPQQLFATEAAIREKVLEQTMKSASDTVVNGLNDSSKLSGAIASLKDSGQNLSLNQFSNETANLALSKSQTVAISGRSAFKPIRLGDTALKVKPEVVRKFSAITHDTLKEIKADTAFSMAAQINALIAERADIFNQVQNLVKPGYQVELKRFGKTTVSIKTLAYPQLLALDPIAMLDYLPTIDFSSTSSIPTSHASISPAGAMDLHIVKQQLKGYELGEISHVENILKGELKDRIHRTRLQTEIITTRESETETAKETSLETTDRFEMQRESKEALSEQTNVRGSLTVQGSYGPSFSFQASAEASWSRNQEQSASASSTIAREVTQKATEKITERILRSETRKILREVEESNQHTFDNKNGAEHVIGTYQWLNKVYEAQVFNFGQRTIYDLMIPEPGAFLLEAFQRKRTQALEIVRPASFDIEPKSLTYENYQRFVSLYGATDVVPPPEPFMTETYDFHTGGGEKDKKFTDSTRIRIPDGFEALSATMGAVVMIWDNWVVDVILGQRAHRFKEDSGWVWSTPLNRETGSVPLAMVTHQVGDFAVAVEVQCQRTERALELWQAVTHAKLTEAYNSRLSEYEAKLAELTAEAPPELPSSSSQKNLSIMTDEIKRSCISLLTLQHFDLFSAINSGSLGLPVINFREAESEGAYVRFFEQAFEWENISWITYPYFWGRKNQWLDKISISDDDSNFESFLKAGYTRVILPVRPGFESAVDHFRLFGEVWEGGSLPTISDETYLPLAEEMALRLDRPGDEIPIGEPWEFTVPTSLVKLRADDTLPTWVKQLDGSWTAQ